MFKFLREKIAEIAAAVDLRGGITCDLQMIDEWDDNGEVMTTYEIHPYVNGKQVGYMDFIVHNFTDNIEENYIEIISIKIDDEYQGLGISTQVYKVFSDLYKQKFDGYPMERLFQNPVAEYSFRSAVANGYVDSTLLDNSRIQRDYKNDEKKQQWNDLNNKLPEDVKGTEVRVGKYMPNIKIAATDTLVDLRNVTINVNYQDSDEYMATVDIDAVIDGNDVGYMTISVDKEEQTIEIEMMEVNEEYRKHGIGAELYREFGKVYEERFNGWPVIRYFINPVAEYAFRKAVSLGWISEQAITEDHVEREYSKENDATWKDLRKKLPENFQGPETFANRRDFRRILTAAAPADLRNITTSIALVDTEEDDDEEYYYYGGTYDIVAMVGAEEVGRLRFVETRTRIDGKDEVFLYLAKIEVENKYREHGIGTLLYKEFGDTYAQHYAGWEVERHFENPVAEYAFKKAIELGYVSNEAFTAERTTRDYSPEQLKLWNDVLAPKLQKASRRDLRRVVKSMIKKTAAILDLRRKSLPENTTNLMNQPLSSNVIDLRKRALPPNVTDLRNINKLQFDTLDDYYKERGMNSQASLKDLRKTIGASAIKELRKLKGMNQ